MVRHTLKILQQMLHDFWSVSDHFGTLCIKGLNIIESFWYITHQRFDHDSQFPKWQNINADVTQTLVLRLHFAVSLMISSTSFTFWCQIVCWYISLISAIDDISASALKLNNILVNVQELPYKWNMSFNPERTKQVQETLFSRKTKKGCHSSFLYNNQAAEKPIA